MQAKISPRIYCTKKQRSDLNKLRHMVMLWFNFFLGLNFIFLCFRIIIIHYHNLKQREMKFKPRIKLNHNIYNTHKTLGRPRAAVAEEFYPFLIRDKSNIYVFRQSAELKCTFVTS